jgi:hypothetical protein
LENRVLRIIGCKSDGVTREWRKLHNEELHDLYSSPNNVRVIKLRRIRWEGSEGRIGEERGVHRVCLENLRKTDHWGDKGVDERILRWIFLEVGCGVWTGLG